MNFPLVLKAAATAGRNFFLRDERMERARTFSTTSQRRFYVQAARTHHRIAMEAAASAKRLIEIKELT